MDLLLGVHRPAVDTDGNILNETIKEPLDLDLWTTRLAQQHSTTDTAAADGGRVMLGPCSASPPSYTPLSNEEGVNSLSPRSPESSSPAGAVVAEDGTAPSANVNGGVGGGSSSDSSSDDEDEVLSVGLRHDDLRQRRRTRPPPGRRNATAEAEATARRGARAEGAAKGEGAGGAAFVGGGGAGDRPGVAGAVVERATGAALTELRMAAPYSVLALTVRILNAGRCL